MTKRIELTELMRIVDNAFDAGETESLITEEESKTAKAQILQDQEKAERFDEEIERLKEYIVKYPEAKEQIWHIPQIIKLFQKIRDGDKKDDWEGDPKLRKARP